jgi:hypothetical protein
MQKHVRKKHPNAGAGRLFVSHPIQQFNPSGSASVYWKVKPPGAAEFNLGSDPKSRRIMEFIVPEHNSLISAETYHHRSNEIREIAPWLLAFGWNDLAAQFDPQLLHHAARPVLASDTLRPLQLMVDEYMDAALSQVKLTHLIIRQRVNTPYREKT